MSVPMDGLWLAVQFETRFLSSLKTLVLCGLKRVLDCPMARHAELGETLRKGQEPGAPGRMAWSKEWWMGQRQRESQSLVAGGRASLHDDAYSLHNMITMSHGESERSQEDENFK